jgi:hypothetical protein
MDEMNTRIETREYVIAHGHSPRGRGAWAFRMRLANGHPVDLYRRDLRPGWRDGIYWVNGSYTTAKAAALREGRRLGAAVVSVGS